MSDTKSRKPFVDFRAIRSAITMEQVLQHYGLLDQFKRSGDTLTGRCPIHRGSNPTQFRVSLSKNLWNCFSECKHGGNTLDFVARMENVPVHDAALKVCAWFNLPADAAPAAGAEEPERPAPRAKPKPSAPAKPEDDGPNPPLEFKLEKLERSHPYLTDRGLTPQTVIDFGAGYFAGSKGLMVGRVVIPIHNVNGEVVAYAGRWPGEPAEDTPKYRLPPGFKKSRELFNLDRAVKEPVDLPWIIVEGFFDAMKLHQHGCRKVVALMGSSLSPAQEALLKEHARPRSRVTVMLDEDDAGRAARTDIAARLSRFCFVHVHAFPEEGMQPEHLEAGEVRRLMEGGT
jgi:DNA primase